MPKIVCPGGSLRAADLVSVVISEAMFMVPEIVRTRKADAHPDAVIVIGVGEKCDGIKNFDLTALSSLEQRRSGVNICQAGMLWKAFGKDICQRLVLDDGELPLGADIDELVNMIDAEFVQEIDLQDRFTASPSRAIRAMVGGSPIQHTITEFISLMNPVARLEDTSPQCYDRRFNEVKTFVASLFWAVAKGCYRKWLDNIAVRRADQGSSILVITESGVDWQAIVDRLPHIKLVVHPFKGNYSAETPVTPAGRQPRCLLPAGWAGKPREELVKVTGVQDVIMADRERHWVSARSFESATRLAELALSDQAAPVSIPAEPLSVTAVPVS
jgi:uncharacterized UPF0160 family protein